MYLKVICVFLVNIFVLIVHARVPPILSGSEFDIKNHNSSVTFYFPWIATIWYKHETKGNQISQCLGSLINEEYILTAGNCFAPIIRSTLGLKVDHVRLGAGSSTTYCYENRECIEVAVEKEIMHPNFTLRPTTNDIALLKLAKPVKLSEKFKPICVPKINADNGTTGYFLNREDIQTIKTTIVDNSFCEDSYKSASISIEESQLCGEGVYEGRFCRSSGGSPLMVPGDAKQGCEWYMQGIMSFGPVPCGVTEDVFTRVFYYYDWIMENIK